MLLLSAHLQLHAHGRPAALCVQTGLRALSFCCCSFSAAPNRTSKEIVELNNGMFGAAALAQADPKAITRRRAHGILMALNFIIIFPLGALAARQLRCHWITNPRVRAAMFYVHICTQVRRLLPQTDWGLLVRERTEASAGAG